MVTYATEMAHQTVLEYPVPRALDYSRPLELEALRPVSFYFPVSWPSMPRGHISCLQGQMRTKRRPATPASRLPSAYSSVSVSVKSAPTHIRLLDARKYEATRRELERTGELRKITKKYEPFKLPGSDGDRWAKITTENSIIETSIK